MNTRLEEWFDRLAALPDMSDVHNLFSSRTPDGQIRLTNLRRYFEQVLALAPDTLLVGEAPGYQGTYRTGVSFCSESILLGPQNRFGLFGGEANGYQRVYDGDHIWKEPSATVVQRVMNELPKLPLIWATFPLHPYQPGKPLSNRAPRPAEVALGAELLKELIDIIRPARVVAVGNVAADCLAKLDIEAVKVRHPSHGGATLFREQLLALIG